MKVYGYDIEDNFHELREGSIECTVEELDKLCQFFLHVREQHKKAIGKTEMCHSHYRDWDKDWNGENSDVIVITVFDEHSNAN